MGWLFAAVARRVRAMLLADAAVWLEARFHALAADRRAWLHAEADRHEAAGRKDVAAELRRRAIEFSTNRPLAAVRAAVADLATDRSGATTGRTGTSPEPKSLPDRGAAGHGRGAADRVG